ncbi:hypothetical protein Q8F55_006797 [Vanrija albida]|uniref:Peptidase A1 domain-containing protein n=1 Tax=Vanrija albida TaxID=181172 RepID=A0ABR3PY87_9TREE
MHASTLLLVLAALATSAQGAALPAARASSLPLSTPPRSLADDGRTALDRVLDEALHQQLKAEQALPHAEREQLQRRAAERVAERSELAKRDGAAISPLYNVAGDMSYGIEIAVGTPPQPFWVMADTGSGDLILWDKNCTQCGDAARFDSSRSKTIAPSRLSPALHNFAYGSGKGTGSWVSETVSIGAASVDNYNVTLVSSGDIAGTAVSPLSGIAGFFLNGHPTSLWKAIADANKWTDKQFGFYLKRRNWDKKYGSSADGGELSLGGINTTYIDGDMEYYPADANAWWRLALYSIVVGDTDKPSSYIMTNNTLTIMDTGATLISLPHAYAKAFYDKIPGSQVIKTDASGGPISWSIPCDTKTTVGVKFAVDYARTWNIAPADLTRGRVGNTTQCVGAVVPGGSQLGAAFLKNVYSAWKYDPPMIGFGKLKDQYNVQPNPS